MTAQAQSTLTINANFATLMRAKARAYPGLMDMAEKLHGGLIANMPEWLKVEMMNDNLELFACSPDGLKMLAKFPTREAFDELAAYYYKKTGLQATATERGVPNVITTYAANLLDHLAYEWSSVAVKSITP